MAEKSTHTPEELKVVEQLGQARSLLLQEIHKVIIGQDQVIEELLLAMFSRGHCLMVGVPGLAKTLLISTIASVLKLKFSRIQFTPDLMPSDITGTDVIEENRTTGERSFRFIRGPIFGNVILADEINRTPPKTQSALLEAMQEYNVTSMGKSYALERPFIVVATQNPIEQEGTYPLPEAQLDRFMFSLWVDYPSVEEEEEIVMATTAPQERAVQEVFSREQMMTFQELVRRIPASRHVVSYAVAIARATRPISGTAGDYVRQYVEWGAGPRASQYMVLAGKALAVLDGQTSVCAEHVRTAAGFVLRHRVLPNYNATGEGITAQQIVEKVLSEIKEPDYR